MEKTAHTPGPWEIRVAFFKKNLPAYAVFAGDEMVCTLPGTAFCNLPPNAALIAAAPEMLAALIACEAVLAGEGGHEGGAFLCELKDFILRAGGRIASADFLNGANHELEI